MYFKFYNIIKKISEQLQIDQINYVINDIESYTNYFYLRKITFKLLLPLDCLINLKII